MNFLLLVLFPQSAMFFVVCNVNTNRVENNVMQESAEIEEEQAAVPGPSTSSAAFQGGRCTSSSAVVWGNNTLFQSSMMFLFHLYSETQTIKPSYFYFYSYWAG